MENKKVYLIGNENIGFYGHTYDKEDLKNFMKTRTGFEYKKLKLTKRLQDNLSINTEVIAIADDVYMTANEEEYFIESFIQLKTEIPHDIVKLRRNLKYLRLTSDEKEILRQFKDFLDNFLEASESDEYDSYEIWDTIKAARWFVKNVLNNNR